MYHIMFYEHVCYAICVNSHLNITYTWHLKPPFDSPSPSTAPHPPTAFARRSCARCKNWICWHNCIRKCLQVSSYGGRNLISKETFHIKVNDSIEWTFINISKNLSLYGLNANTTVEFKASSSRRLTPTAVGSLYLNVNWASSRTHYRVY